METVKTTLPALADLLHPRDGTVTLSLDRPATGPRTHLRGPQDGPIAAGTADRIRRSLRDLERAFDPLEIATAEGHLAAPAQAGAELDLAVVRRTGALLQCAAMMPPSLHGRSLSLSLAFEQRSTTMEGYAVAVQARVKLLDGGPRTTKLDEALCRTRHLAVELGQELVDQTLGPWMRDSGVTLLIAGRILDIALDVETTHELLP